MYVCVNGVVVCICVWCICSVCVCVCGMCRGVLYACVCVMCMWCLYVYECVYMCGDGVICIYVVRDMCMYLWCMWGFMWGGVCEWWGV